MDEDKFREEATALLRLAAELSKECGKPLHIAIYPDGKGWCTPEGMGIDVQIGFKNL